MAPVSKPRYTMRVVVIRNPEAGRGNENLEELVRRALLKGDCEECELRITDAYGHGAELAREAVENGIDVVAACGGDGTLADVASGLIGSEVPMAILPGGTGNVVAKEFGIPADIEKAAELILTGEKAKVDAGLLNGEKHFLLRCDIGASVRVNQEATRELKSQFGIFAYLIGILKTRPGRISFRFLLDDSDEAIEAEGVTCFIANVGAMGMLDLELPKVSAEDGVLDVFVIRGAGELMQGATLQMLQLDELVKLELQHWRAKKIRVETPDQPEETAYDGEDFGKTPCTIEIVPQALRILQPPA